jgi:hypothetical protein
MLTSNTYGWQDKGGQFLPGDAGASLTAARHSFAAIYGCAVKAFMASPNAARLASQARRGEVTVSS